MMTEWANEANKINWREWMDQLNREHASDSFGDTAEDDTETIHKSEWVEFMWDGTHPSHCSISCSHN